MSTLLERIFHPCLHEWKFLEEHRIIRSLSVGGQTTDTSVYLAKVYECKKCGKLKKEVVDL